MWERRLPEDIAAIQRRKRYSRLNPSIPLLGAALAAWWPVIAHWQGWGGKHIPPKPPEPFSEALLVYPIAFVALFVAFYIVRLLGVLRDTRSTMICVRCQSVQEPTSEGRCSCAGELEPLEHWASDDDSARRLL